MECNIPLLYSRITALNARVIAKALSQPRGAPFVNRVKIELHKNPKLPNTQHLDSRHGKTCKEVQPM